MPVPVFAKVGVNFEVNVEVLVDPTNICVELLVKPEPETVIVYNPDALPAKSISKL